MSRHPPGTAFDPYRQKDYERRKAEGFPPPLYESKIPTPEYVPERKGSIVDNLNQGFIHQHQK